MCRNLEHAVRRGIDDGVACFHVLHAQILNDDRTGFGIVAECFCADCRFKGIHDLLGEACFRKGREGPFGDNACHFPMPCCGILADGAFCHFAVATLRCGNLAKKRDILALDIPQT